MKKNKIKLCLVITLACLVLVSFTACGKTAEIEQQLVKVTRGDLVTSVSADGNLSLPLHRKLTFGTAGTVAKVNVEEGDQVTEGQVLASLDTSSLELAVRSAEIDLEMATDNYRKLTYPYDYHAMAIDVPNATALITDAKREVDSALEVMLELGQSREQYSWQQYWDVWHNLKKAQDDLVRAKENLVRGYGQDVFESGILPMRDRWTVRAAQLEMEKAELALDKARDELEKAVIIAPFDGVIAASNVKEGDKLSSMDYATKVIFEVIDPSHMELDAEVDEIDIPGVKLGQGAIISVDALPEVEIEGKVTSISPLSTEKSGLILYRVKVSFDVPENSGLKSGMSASADIIIDKRSNVLLVPNRAIEHDSSGNPVVQVMVGEQTEERPVILGISDGFQTEIVDGLAEGDTVVIERQSKPESPGGFLFGG